MAGLWGPRGGNRIRVGFFYDSLELSPDGRRARIRGGRVRIERPVKVVDRQNVFTWTGGAVTDGSKSNVNITGVGNKTVAAVEGQWVTLSSTKNVTASLKVVASGVNQANGDLSVNLTIKYPMLNPFAPPSDSGGGEAFPNPWEHEDAPDLHLEDFVEYDYALTFPMIYDDNMALLAWDIEVTLDGGRSPYGTARWKMDLEYGEEKDDMFTWTSPFSEPIVQIDAGWKFGNTVNRYPIFTGVITGREMIISSDAAYIQFEAESYETIIDFPSDLTRAVDPAWTTLGQFFAAGVFAKSPVFTEHAGNLAPLSTGVTEYRSMSMEVNDNLGDFARSAASALGQWVRGSMTAFTPTIEVIQDPYPYRRVLSLPLDMFSDFRRIESLDNWANIVEVEAQWTDAATGDTKSKRKTYRTAAANNGNGAVRGKQVTLNVKPPGGATPSASWATGKRWLRRVDESGRGGYSGELRAVWWVQPRIDAVLITDNPIEDTAGAVQTVTFMVDQGLMRLTWAAVHSP